MSQNGYPPGGKKWLPTHNVHKNQFQMDYRSKCEQ